MRKAFEFIVYIFYHYYDKGSTQSIAYPSSIMVTVFMIYMNIITLLSICGLISILPNFIAYGKGIGLLGMMLFFLPFYFLLAFFVKKKNITNKSYPNRVIKAGNISVLFYVIFSILSMMFVLISLRNS